MMGVHVKIRRNGERFWLSDVERVDEKTFKGHVANDLVVNTDLSLGDEVKFTEDEVFEIKVFQAN